MCQWRFRIHRGAECVHMRYCVIYRVTPEDHNITRRGISKDAGFPIRVRGQEEVQPWLVNLNQETIRAPPSEEMVGNALS